MLHCIGGNATENACAIRTDHKRLQPDQISPKPAHPWRKVARAKNGYTVSEPSSLTKTNRIISKQGLDRRGLAEIVRTKQIKQVSRDGPTLPDHLLPGLDVIFIGVNPGLYSVKHGHYFARRTNRFWPAFSRSRLSEQVRRGLAVESLQPEHDRELPRFGFGLTDVVKRASSNASQLCRIDFEQGAPVLADKLRHYRPRVACFHGVTAYRPFSAFALNHLSPKSPLGPQPELIGSTRIYVVPNPSPANAHFTVADQAAWYDELSAFLHDLNRN